MFSFVLSFEVYRIISYHNTILYHIKHQPINEVGSRFMALFTGDNCNNYEVKQIYLKPSSLQINIAPNKLKLSRSVRYLGMQTGRQAFW